MRRLGWAALVAVVGCSETTGTLADAGPSDAGPGDPGACTLGPLRLALSVQRTTDGGPATDANVAEVATAASGASFLLADGERVTVYVEGDLPAPVIAPGTPVHIVARQDGPGDLVVIRAFADGGSGALLYAAWEGTRTDVVEELRADGIVATYALDPCAPSELQPFGLPCGLARSRSITVEYRPAAPGVDGGTAVVPSGTTVGLGPYRVLNGRSHEHLDFRCADIPSGARSGAVFLP